MNEKKVKHFLERFHQVQEAERRLFCLYNAIGLHAGWSEVEHWVNAHGGDASFVQAVRALQDKERDAASEDKGSMATCCGTITPQMLDELAAALEMEQSQAEGIAKD